MNAEEKSSAPTRSEANEAQEDYSLCSSSTDDRFKSPMVDVEGKFASSILLVVAVEGKIAPKRIFSF